MAVVGDRHVVLSLAGGNERLAHAIAALEAGEAPWAAEAQGLSMTPQPSVRGTCSGPMRTSVPRCDSPVVFSTHSTAPRPPAPPSERPAGWLTMGVTTPAPNETAITVVLPDTLLRAR